MSNTVTFTKKEFVGLKKAYELAVKQEAKSFTYDGNEYVTGYAKYLLEYLTPKFK